MANKVFANGREVSCKSADGKTICAFPDVCWSPPSPPAGPIPVPYPNTAFATDTTNGSRTVKISGKEVMLKDKSYFKKSTGDEPATRALGMGVITHTITGKVYFNSWSMDVKFEGENVDRHFDLTTDNHASQTGNTPPWPYTDRMKMAKDTKACDKETKEVNDNCDMSKPPSCPDNSDLKKAVKARNRTKRDSANRDKANVEVEKQYKKFAASIKKDKCQRALRCFLSSYKPSRCCPGQTPDHLIDAASFLKKGDSGQSRNSRPKRDGWKKYSVNAAPCICVEGGFTSATHGTLSVRRGVKALHEKDVNGEWSRKAATKTASRAVNKTFRGCSEKCIEAQLNKYHEKASTSVPEKPIKANVAMTSDEGEQRSAQAVMGVPLPKRV